jgi:hypothetical protein
LQSLRNGYSDLRQQAGKRGRQQNLMSLELFIAIKVISAFAFYGDQSADVSPLCLSADFLLKPQRFSPSVEAFF